MADQLLVQEATSQTYDSAAPVALVIAEDDAQARSAMDALALAGCRARARLRFAEAADALDRCDGLDLVLIDAAGAPDALLDALIEAV